MVNLELFRVFYTVAKCGSLTKAGEQLYISQSAVSQAIKQLETGLGGKLFNRTSKGMELTENGLQIFGAVEKALTLLDGAEKTFTQLKDMATGTIKICASDTISTHYLLPFIKEYKEKYPQVKISLINGTTTEIIDLIKNKKGDIGLVNTPIPEGEVEYLGGVMTLHDVFCASAKFNRLTEQTIPLKRLQDFPLLLLELPTVTGQAVVEFAKAQGVKLKPEIQPSSIELLISLAKIGMGVACVPKEFILEELKENSLFEIKTDPALPERGVGLVVAKGEDLTFAVKEFIKLLGEK